MRWFRCRFLCVALAGLGSIVSTSAQSRPTALLTNYTLQSWRVADGLPESSVNAIVQTDDHYLWLGTYNGLARFDGVAFTVFGLEHGLKSTQISALLKGTNGALWIGTLGGGVTRYANGKFETFTTHEGLADNSIVSLAPGTDGTCWVATLGGVSHWNAGRLQRFPLDPIVDKEIRYVGECKDGSLLVTTAKSGLLEYRNGELRALPAPTQDRTLRLRPLLRERTSDWWIGAQDGNLFLLSNERSNIKSFTPRDGLPAEDIWTLAQTSDARIWIGFFHGGIAVREGDKFSTLTTRDGLMSNSIRALYEDRERNIWVGTPEGLQRISPRKVTILDTTDGLATKQISTVAQANDGSLWIGTDGSGVYRRDPQGIVEAFEVPPLRKGRGSVASLLVGRDGTVWVGGWGSGLYQFKNGQLVHHYTQANGFPDITPTALFEDFDETIWVGTYTHGLGRLRNRQFEPYTNAPSPPLFQPRAIVRDKTGDLWIGSNGTGLLRLHEDQFTRFDAQTELRAQAIASLCADSDGSLWIGTYGAGLALHEQGRFYSFSKRSGLPEEVIAQIQEDDSGHLYLGCTRAVIRVAKSDLRAFAAGRASRIPFGVIGRNVGMPEAECSIGTPQQVYDDDHRTLWFPTRHGLVGLEPSLFNAQREAPPVYIEHVDMDGRGAPRFTSISEGQLVVAPPSNLSLEFSYTAVSLSSPEGCQFEHYLEPYDEDWVPAGSRRTVRYTRVPPGQYRFRVRTWSEGGISNEASVAIVVLPRFWQTAWFRSLAVAMLGTAIVVVYSRRVRSLHRRRLEQESFSQQLLASQEAERQRIAGELHDSLGQNLLLIKNRSQLGLIAAENASAVSKELEGISELSSAAIDEVRTLAHSLRPFQLDQLGFSEALEIMIDNLATATGLPFSHRIENVDEQLTSGSATNLYRIAQESLNNIVKHAHATEARVELKLFEREIRLGIKDNGCGFDTAQLRAGFGISGIRQRVRILGGTFKMQSNPGAGTELLIGVPTPCDHEP